MRTWSRVLWTCRCGLCNQTLQRGDPVVRITVPAMTRVLLRCAQCVGPAPPDLPALVEEKPHEPLTMAPVRELARDFKVQAAGE